MYGGSGRSPDIYLTRHSLILRWFLQQLVAEKSPIKSFTVSFDNTVSFFWFVFFLCLWTKKENEHKKKREIITVIPPILWHKERVEPNVHYLLIKQNSKTLIISWSHFSGFALAQPKKKANLPTDCSIHTESNFH